MAYGICIASAFMGRSTPITAFDGAIYTLPIQYILYCMRGSRNVRQGGSIQVSLTKKALTTFFFFFFFSPQLISEVKWSFSKKTIIFQGCRGGPTFSRGGPTFSRGGPIAYSI